MSERENAEELPWRRRPPIRELDPIPWPHRRCRRRRAKGARISQKRKTGAPISAAALFPRNANATVVTSLAGIGLDRTRVELVADPALKRNQHRISARSAFGTLQITLENEPSPVNPKSSELTALSLVRLIERQLSPLLI
jgi:predicted dinucleotide-utilizing enzyme